MDKPEVQTTEKPKEKSFTKEAYLKSQEYKLYQDLLKVLLKDGGKYTKKEVNTIIQNYFKSEVM